MDFDNHQDGFEIVHRKYETQVYNFMRTTLPEGQAEDATVETFLSAYRAWDRRQNPLVSDSDWLMEMAQSTRERLEYRPDSE